MNRSTGQRQVISVSWPIRLFGDLQDLLRLPVVTMGVDLCTGITAAPRQDNVFRIAGGGLDEPLLVAPDGGTDFAARVPSFVTGLCAATAKKLDLKCGYDVEIHTRVPGLIDLRNCPVATVAWTVALLSLGGALTELSGEEVAEMVVGVMAEDARNEWGAPEIYACILGGILTTTWREKAFVLPVERSLPGMVVGYSTQAGKAALEESAAEEAVGRLVSRLGAESFTCVSFDDVIEGLKDASEADARLCYAHLMIRDHCRYGRTMLDGPDEIDDDRLGEALDGTHEMLRDYLGINEEEVERLIDAANVAGALGCKPVPGTGMFIAFAPGIEERIVAAVREAGGEAHGAVISDGMRVEER